MRLGNDILSYLKYKYETLLGADHLTFDGMGGGGGVILIKKSCKAILKKYLH